MRKRKQVNLPDSHLGKFMKFVESLGIRATIGMVTMPWGGRCWTILESATAAEVRKNINRVLEPRVKKLAPAQYSRYEKALAPMIAGGLFTTYPGKASFMDLQRALQQSAENLLIEHLAPVFEVMGWTYKEQVGYWHETRNKFKKIIRRELKGGVVTLDHVLRRGLKEEDWDKWWRDFRKSARDLRNDAKRRTRARADKLPRKITQAAMATELKCTAQHISRRCRERFPGAKGDNAFARALDWVIHR
jgi:hypothetical protein